MTPKFQPISLVDLDDTLFQTHRRKQPAEDWVVASVDKNNQPLAYMSLKQQYFLSFLLTSTTPIAVTARSVEAFNRVKIEFNNGAVCSHGATILNPDGSLDQQWHDVMLQDLKPFDDAYFSKLAEHIVDIIEQNQFKDTVRHWIVQENNLNIYFVVKQNNHTTENAFLDQIPQLIDSAYLDDLYVHSNGNNLALIPKPVSKARAVDYLLQKIKTNNPHTPILGFGDSLSDLNFMFKTDFACIPTGSQSHSWVKSKFAEQNLKFGTMTNE